MKPEGKDRKEDQQRTGDPNSGQLLICRRSVIPMTLVSVGLVQPALVLVSFLSFLAVSTSELSQIAGEDDENLTYLSNTVLPLEPSGDDMGARRRAQL